MLPFWMHADDDCMTYAWAWRHLKTITFDKSPWNSEIKAFVCNLDVFVGRLNRIAHRAVITSARMQVEAGDNISLLFVCFTKRLYKAISRHVSCHVAFKRQSLYSLLPVSVWREFFHLHCLKLDRHNYLTSDLKRLVTDVFRRESREMCALTFHWQRGRKERERGGLAPRQGLPDSYSETVVFLLAVIDDNRVLCWFLLLSRPPRPSPQTLPFMSRDQLTHVCPVEWRVTPLRFQRNQSAPSFLFKAAAL